MQNNEFETIIKMLTYSEERLINKINGVNENIKDTEKSLKVNIETVQQSVNKINGRLRDVELKTHDLGKDYKSQTTICNGKFEKIIPALKVVQHANFFIRSPKKTLIGFILFIALIQYVILKLADYNIIELLIAKLIN